MLEIGGLQLGTIFQGATFAAIITAIMGALGIWIKYGPERGRVSNERKELELSEMEKALAAYAEQIKVFRDEVHKYRNELQAVQGELHTSDKISSQRSNWVNDLVFVIELLIAELETDKPKSLAVKQAKEVIKRMGAGDPAKTDAMNTAESAVRDAQQTLRSTEHTVVEIKADEAKVAKNGNGK